YRRKRRPAAAHQIRAGRVSTWSFGGVRKRPDVHHMPRIGTLISGLIAAMEAVRSLGENMNQLNGLKGLGSDGS
ncbi:hypothetical protein AB9F39_35445, partial [Rhizobium leguminosarum]